MAEDARPYLENDRPPAMSSAGAVVIEANLAKVFLWLGGGSAVSCIGIGLWAGITLTTINSSIQNLQNSGSALAASDTDQDRRLTALEITVAGFGALRERMDIGFAEITKRLDRMEE